MFLLLSCKHDTAQNCDTSTHTCVSDVSKITVFCSCEKKVALYEPSFPAFVSHFKTFMLTGIPTDEEQATGLEKIIMKAMKEGSVRSFLCGQFWNE